MNRPVLFSLGALSGLLITLAACDATDRSSAFPESVAQLDEAGEIVVLASTEAREAIVRGGIARMHPNRELAALEAEPVVSKIGPAFFLVGQGTDTEGRCMTVALNLGDGTDDELGRLKNDGTLERAPGGDHSCTGQNCSGCQLNYQGGSGYYCHCFMPGGGEGGAWCDHSCTGNC